MVRLINHDTSSDEKHTAILLLMKPGVWYCFSNYAGCELMPECDSRISSRLIEALTLKGFVESVPVFDGFMTKKHRITSSGISWLATH